MLLAAVSGFGTGATGFAQSTATVPTAAIVAELQSLAGKAGTIFVGQIVKVERQGSTVLVSFRVEQPVCGGAGGTFVMREWAGNWAPGVMRYSVGQRVLAFVHGASGNGFSSPVHGAEGLVPVVVQGAHTAALLDIRRVAASVVRAPGTSLPTEAEGALPLPAVLATLTAPASGSGVSPVRGPLPSRGTRPVEAPWMWRTQGGDGGRQASGKPGIVNLPMEVLR